MFQAAGMSRVIGVGTSATRALVSGCRAGTVDEDDGKGEVGGSWAYGLCEMLVHEVGLDLVCFCLLGALFSSVVVAAQVWQSSVGTNRI